jgi:hypothetical protein
MVLRDALTSITVVLRESGPVGTPAEADLGINVSVDGQAFGGHNDKVWIGRDDWAAFLQNLRELERTRRGEARVKGMSPEEFQLAVFPSGNSGRLVAEGWVEVRCAPSRGGLVVKTQPSPVRAVDGVPQ